MLGIGFENVDALVAFLGAFPKLRLEKAFLDREVPRELRFDPFGQLVEAIVSGLDGVGGINKDADVGVLLLDDLEDVHDVLLLRKRARSKRAR